MFTGIIAEQGRVESLDLNPATDSAVLTFTAPQTASGLGLGGSIAVNGVCLTAVALDGSRVSVDVMGETLTRTTTGTLQPGQTVNLERCVPAGGRLDGHVVQGHVDGVGTIVDKRLEANAIHYGIQVPKALMRYVVPKGSVAVDGISLTVVSCLPDAFQITIIPHTAAVTAIGRKSLGATVNIECDMIGKYVERVLQTRLEGEGAEPGELQLALLRRHGFVE